MNLFHKLWVRYSTIIQFLKLHILVKSENVKFEGGCSIKKGVRVRATDDGSAWFGLNVSIDRFSDITVKQGKLIVGANSYIGQFCVICARDKIIIGDNCLIAEHVTIRDQDHIFEEGRMTNAAGFNCAPVEIGANVWIGAKVTITKGVSIGKNAVIGANSVVTHNVAPNSVVGGVPAHTLQRMK